MDFSGRNHSGFTTKAPQTLDDFDSALNEQGVVEETKLRLRAEIEDVFL